MPVAPPAPEQPDKLLPQEVWLPYREGEPLTIGDAELVPGHNLVRRGVQELAALFESYDVTVNTARAVRLEERGEVTYNIPCGPGERATAQKNVETGQVQILGMIVIDGASKLPLGAYVDLLRPADRAQIAALLGDATQDAAAQAVQAAGELWERVLVSGDSREGHTSLALVQRDRPTTDAPVAAIWYGSKICTRERDGVKVCEQCKWYELVPWVPECKG